MEQHVRKSNRLKHYNYSSPGAYFLTICTEGQQPILSRIVGGGALDAPEIRLTKTGHIVRDCLLSGNQIPGVTVDKFVIMPNHIHIILIIDAAVSGEITQATSPANAVIPHFIATFKRFCHRDAGRRIFQRSYHDHVIRNSSDYRRIWQYIDNNPARWQEDCFYTEQSLRGVEGAAPYITPLEDTL